MCGVAEESHLLGRRDVSTGRYVAAFRRTSQTCDPKRKITSLFRNVANYLSLHKTWRLRILKIAKIVFRIVTFRKDLLPTPSGLNFCAED